MKKPFVPKPGQIDYTNKREAPVVNTLVIHNEKLLLVKRSEEANFYPGFWHGIAGFIDDEKNALEKAKEELCEEAKICSQEIISAKLLKIVEKNDPQYNKTWKIHFIRVDVTISDVELDWEASAYQWVSKAELKNIEPMIPIFKKTALKFL